MGAPETPNVRGMMKKIYCVIVCLCLMACGGSGSPTGSGSGSGSGSGTGSGSGSGTGSGGGTTQPTTPTVQNRAFVLSSLSIDSGASPLQIVPPDATGRLDMQANGAYSLTFVVALNNFSWSESIVGTHTFSGNTLNMTPADSVKTAVVPFQQTVIVDNLAVPWQSESQVVITLPIRPGAWRSEDVISLTFTQTQVVSKPANGGQSDGRFDYVALMDALR